MTILKNIKAAWNRLSEEGARIQAEKAAREREMFDIAAINFINGYGENFHCSDDQLKRFQRACSSDTIGAVSSLNKKKLCAKIKSSYEPDTIYSTSLSDCTCPDFQRRKLPCKHIYKLALELGIVTKDWDLSGIPDTVKELFSSLSYTDKVKYLYLISKYNGQEYFEVRQQEISTAFLSKVFLRIIHSKH